MNFKLENMEQEDSLRERIIDLEFELEGTRDRMMIYSEILSNIELSIDELTRREEENERFHFNEQIDYRECIINLKKHLNEYKRVYSINF
jgi:hypothetical protein